MNEDYVDYDVAKMLKELGFNHDVYSYFSCYDNINIELYDNIKDGIGDMNDMDLEDSDMVYISRPTLYQAQKFLREKYQVFITVKIPYKVWDQYSAVVMTSIPALNAAALLIDGFTVYDTPEQALSEGIKETCIFIR